MPRVFIVLFLVALTIYSFIDCARTDSNRMPARISKAVWLILIAIVPVLGPLLWLFFKYQYIFKDNSSRARQDFPSKTRNPRTAERGPVAPDDDPEFLARLEAQNRRRAFEQKRAEEGKSPERTKKDDDESRGLYGS
ncbi:PLD nuclease N-terminal domain-containing protein [Arcanobacterium bovis]|uniref:Phospholipase n=1 Tax=Arcanobacterium bovis TaxID=2529275 RepID=A0A4Q9UZS2_9ACTO|nr:PLD nuclease N-terminal domain-containing protein [Arcanobacterium bovis]TBW21514.1 phospholipase [Arcanobacterium bovis]